MLLYMYYKSVVYVSVVMEELHRIAFRNALSNPLYCPSFNISKHSHDDVSVGSSVFVLIFRMYMHMY